MYYHLTRFIVDNILNSFNRRSGLNKINTHRNKNGDNSSNKYSRRLKSRKKEKRL